MAQPPLSETDVRDVAARILRAIEQTPGSRRDGRDLLPALSADDERRVLAAMAALRSGAATPAGDSPRALGSDHTPRGAPARSTPGYGTSQGASGATSGGADPGGSVNSPPE